MKRFYRHIALFLLPVVMVWVGIELFYRCADTAYTEKDKQLRTEYKNTETLILGNSHALFGLDPTYFDSRAYNAANISQTLYFDELILNTYLDSLPKLETVIITVSYFSLSQKDNTLGDTWRKYFYKHQMQLEVPLVSQWDPRNYSLALARRFDKSVDLLQLYAEEGTVALIKSNGYGLQDERDIVEDKEAIVPIIVNKHEDGSLDFEQNTQRLQQMIDVCKTKDLNVLLLEMPVYRTYYETLLPEKKEKIVTVLQNLASNNQNTQYLKLSEDKRFTDSDLRDADHLTNEGAKKASGIVSRFIEENFQ